MPRGPPGPRPPLRLPPGGGLPGPPYPGLVEVRLASSCPREVNRGAELGPHQAGPLGSSKASRTNALLLTVPSQGGHGSSPWSRRPPASPGVQGMAAPGATDLEDHPGEKADPPGQQERRPRSRRVPGMGGWEIVNRLNQDGRDRSPWRLLDQSPGSAPATRWPRWR